MSNSDHPAPFDLPRLRLETLAAHVLHYETIDSTNNVALEHCRQDQMPTPLLIITDQQTGGRGRGVNQWWSSQGALTFSLVLKPTELGLLQTSWPQISLMTGLSVCCALNEFLPHHAFALKWPNDVQLLRRKICGVLVEVGPRNTETLVIGIGINVNNSFEQAPEELRSTGISMIDATKREFCLTDVLIRVLQQFQSHLERLSKNDEALAADWRQRCALVGQSIEIETGNRRTSGVCQGIDDEGALVLLTEGGPARFFGGVVTRIW